MRRLTRAIRCGGDAVVTAAVMALLLVGCERRSPSSRSESGQAARATSAPEPAWKKQVGTRIVVEGLAQTVNEKYFGPKSGARLNIGGDFHSIIAIGLEGWPPEEEGKRLRVEGLVGLIPKVQHQVNANSEIIYSQGFDADVPTLSDIQWSPVE